MWEVRTDLTWRVWRGNNSNVSEYILSQSTKSRPPPSHFHNQRDSAPSLLLCQTYLASTRHTLHFNRQIDYMRNHTVQCTISLNTIDFIVYPWALDKRTDNPTPVLSLRQTAQINGKFDTNKSKNADLWKVGMFWFITCDT